MSHAHQRPRANLGGSSDPTSTKTLRDRWSGEVTRRFRELRGVIRTSIVENDCLGLATTRGRTVDRGVTLSANQMRPAKRNQFDFPRDDAKLDAFMQWLDEQEQAGIIERTPNPVPGYTTPTSKWSNEYVRPAYSKGVAHADLEAKRAGLVVDTEDLDFVFRSPRHTQSAALAFSRTYRELNGVTDAMDQQISRALANGLARGAGPREIADDINRSVVGIGQKRANLIARTETVRAFNEAALTRYENMGVGQVGMDVEVRTAGDNRVCDECLAIEEQGPYSIQDARGLLPVHPNCRCAVIPIV